MIVFHPYEDGSAIFVGEQRYIRNELWGTLKMVMVYHFYHLVMAKMNKNGDLEWMIKVPKNQAGVKGRGGMGTQYMQANGRHYLLFLDNERNANISIDDLTVPYKDDKEGILTAYVVDDETGKVEKHLILSTKDINGIKSKKFKTSSIIFLDENQFMLEMSTRGKKDVMVKLELIR